MFIGTPVQQGADGLMCVTLLQQLQVSGVYWHTSTARGRWSNACQSPAAAAGKLCVQYKKGQMVLMHVILLQQLQVSCVSNTKRDRLS